jgi:hypothetical protein
MGGGGALRASIRWAREAVGFEASTAAPTAALLRNARRFTPLPWFEVFLDLRTFALRSPLLYHCLYHERANVGCARDGAPFTLVEFELSARDNELMRGTLRGERIEEMTCFLKAAKAGFCHPAKSASVGWSFRGGW